MNPLKVFVECFGGEPLWKNPAYVTPARHQRKWRDAAKYKYLNRTESKGSYKINANFGKIAQNRTKKGADSNDTNKVLN
jgi:hypothetical protein